MIDDPDQARRLARAICSDIRLYNESAIREPWAPDSPRTIAAAVAEGRRLFATRVDERHSGAFDRALDELGIPRPGGHDAASGAPPAHPPTARADGEAGSGAPLIVALAVAGFVVTLAATVWFMLR